MHYKSKLGQAISGLNHCPINSYENTEFYNDFVKPNKVGSGVGLKLVDELGRFAGISMDFSTKLAETDVTIMKLLNTLSPHLQRVMKLQKQLDGVSAERGYLDATLADSPHAIFLVDHLCRVIWHNTSAEVAISKKRGLHLGFNRRLALNLRSSSNKKLGQLVREAVFATLYDNTDAPNVLKFDVLDETGPNLLTVTPYVGPFCARDVRMAGFFGMTRRALIVVKYRKDVPPLRQDILRAVFGFTPKEIETVLLLADENSLKEIADMLSVRASTTRAHLKSMLSKTDCHRQSDLVRLVLQLAQ